MWGRSLLFLACAALAVAEDAAKTVVKANATVIATKAPASAASAASAAPAMESSVICTTCSCDWDLKLVDCTEKNLNNHFPNPDDWACLNFQPLEIRFDSNQLVHVLPFTKALDTVETLTMSHNHIAKVEEGAFMNLSNVVLIDLSHNHLTSEELSPHIFQGHYAPENYEPLEKLRVLKLSSNALHSLHPDLFEHLPRLEEVYLDSNPLKVIDRNTHITLTSAPFLKVLDLSRTMISKLPEHLLHTPRHLQSLLLAGNNFPNPPEGLADSHELQYLDLSENPFTVLSPLPAMKNLTKLVISHCPDLTEVPKGAFANLPALQHLFLHDNHRLSNINASALVEPPEPPAETHVYPPITTLHLQDNALGYLESSLVARWDKVRDIRLDGNPWVCDCENQWMIQTLLPTMERINITFGAGLKCAQPPEMRDQALHSLEVRHYHMRCLDRLGNRPERDAPLLVGVLVGVLLAAPATLALVLLWRRCPIPPLPGLSKVMGPRWQRGGGEYSSAIYKAADTEPDFI